MTGKRNSSGPRSGAAPARGARSRVLRIIGGTWRSRRLRFPSAPEIRPTPDRVRETLFNWLAPRIAGARCLDLFAGSGALGLEALSRGASRVVFVERERQAAAELRRLLHEWDARGGTLVRADAQRFLAGVAEPFDVVFLDPPFTSRELLSGVAARLETGGWLAPRALIYVECAAREGLPELPSSWKAAKTGRAGEVGYHLLERTARGERSE
ncbi:MAG: 16S rRNA (guanine(966)-N(2))-methyltransferase RsmD [Gammaproteobacteria bacterium]